VTQDFALTPQSNVTLSGQVKDGSGKGYPLYAKIEIAGRDAGPIFTDPANGRYTVDIAGPATYRVTVTPVYPGYQAVVADVAVGTTDTTANFAVPVDASTCTARGYGFPTMLSEAFDDTTAPPPGWRVVNRTESGGWVFNDPGDRGNLTGGDGGFAIVDSDNLGSGRSQDTDLITPTLDLTGVATPVLEFNSDYRAFSNGSADVDVSIDGGTTWTNLWHQTTVSRRGPVVERIPLTGAEHQPNVTVRFRYTGTWAWWWQVDNVRVIDQKCVPQPGGLVVGFVTDKNTGAGINGATVTGGGATATTTATPEDPNIGDGFYSLFAPQVGTQAFTASKAPYQPLTKDANVVDNRTRQVNFALKAGRLSVTPTSVTGFVPFGSTRTTTVTVTNTGSAPATVEVLERGGGFELLNRQGAEVVTTPLTAAQAFPGKVTGASVGLQTVPVPQIDDAWTSKAPYPVTAFDMAAVTLDGKIYSFGNSAASTTNSAFVYDIAEDKWAPLPALPHGRAKPQAVAFDGKIYVFGGWTTGTSLEATVDVFDPATNSWSTVAGATNPAPRAAAGAGLVDRKIYLVGGCADDACTPSRDLVIFDPTTGTFSTGAPYPQTVAWQSCG
ncbi:MAG: choice-of-anchor J domain-containing protein, partial [Dactylosporangium sp.]|nr:choice-of-anchor J domain-containing protein [Dactylosporangium sp.]